MFSAVLASFHFPNLFQYQCGKNTLIIGAPKIMMPLDKVMSNNDVIP